MRLLILFLLYFNACLGQEYTKVTAFTAVANTTHPPCSIVDFIKNPEYGSVFTSYSNDTELIKKLLSLKKKCKRWKNSPHDCHQKNAMSYDDDISNMFVFESNTGNDTIYTTANNKSIVFPRKNIQYFAPANEIERALKDDIKSFFERDFERDLWFPIIGEIDSIPSSKLLLKGKTIDIIKSINDVDINATLIKSERGIIDGVIVEDKTYKFNDNTYAFKYDGRLESIIIFNDDDFFIDGIKIGDDEDNLIAKYPNSTIRQFPEARNFEELKQSYSYTVRVEDNVASIHFSIRKRKIQSIAINLKP